MSLRARLTIGMALVAAVLAVAAVVITRTTEAYLIDQLDAQLHAAGPPRVSPDEELGIEEPLSSIYFGVVSSDGALRTLLTPNLTETDPALPDVDGAEALAAAESGAPFTAGSVDSGARYRVLARYDDRLDGVTVLALSLADVDDAIARLILVEVVATLAVLAVLALVTWWVIRLGVRPIKQMTATATAIAAGDLSRRVPDVRAGTEAGELGLALNQMLTRIEEAFDQRTQSENRLRQFVADASHELRTPVTTIRGYAELYRAGGLADPAELDEALRRTESESIRMGTLVDDLLLLARLDQGRPFQRERVALDTIVRDIVRDASAVDPRRPITAEIDDAGAVMGDDGRLRQVVSNVIGNAVVHTPPGTPIVVRVARAGDRVCLEVTDHGPGMDDDVADRAFERFYRADPARSRHEGGSGLGLAIVAATVAAHDGTATLESAPGRGTTVRIELPAADPVR